jgi:UDP-glucose 4-epimerase
MVARLFNCSGPRQTGEYGIVLPTFVRQALAGEDLTVYGDGEQTRCFCHVLDTVAALVALLDHPGAVGDVFNVGTQELTMNEPLDRGQLQIIPRRGAYHEAYGRASRM